jgi:Cu-processing system ATP-binding protein
LTTSVIELRNVVRCFGDVRAVDGVDLSVERGELFGLIGHNGAGKTTLLRLMLGLLPPTSGEVRIGGEPVRGEAFRRVRRGIGYVPENIALYENLSGLETLLFFARLKRADPATCPALLAQVGLADAARRPVGGYSKGMKQRLAFAQALLGQPALLFLDEPTSGLDPEGIRDFYATLRRLREEQGVTAVLSSHILAELQQRVDRLALMKNGRIAALGTVRSLRERSPLPLRIEVQLHNGAEAAVRRIAGDDRLVRVADQVAHLQCRRDEKMALVAALAALGGQVLDIRIDEPSLEEVFLGTADAAAQDTQ